MFLIGKVEIFRQFWICTDNNGFAFAVVYDLTVAAVIGKLSSAVDTELHYRAIFFDDCVTSHCDFFLDGNYFCTEAFGRFDSFTVTAADDKSGYDSKESENEESHKSASFLNQEIA